MAEVTEAEARLVRAHREAGRLAAALVRDPFATDTVTRLKDYLPQAQEAASAFRDADVEESALLQRIAELSQAAVDGRPGGDAP